MTNPSLGWSGDAVDDEPVQLLNPQGELVHPDLPPPPDDLVREALRLMFLSRALDEKSTNLQRQGRLGLYAPVLGQEAAVIGSHLAIEPGRDWLVPASREQPAMIRHGWPLDALMASLLGRVGGRIPDHVRMLPRQQSIAAQLPHAAGIAWASKIQGLEDVTLVYCGDGATSEGDFHEACNLAGVMGVPMVLVILNNQYAISTPFSSQTRARRLAYRARGYGFPGIAVDGNDLFAVYQTTRHAVERARAGEGPTMIEAVTYRLSFHNTSDNPKLYRDASEVAEATERDPVARLVAYAIGAGLMDASAVEESATEARRAVEAALAKAQSYPTPDPGEIFRHIFAE